MKSASRWLLLPVIFSIVLASGCGPIKIPPTPTETAVPTPTVPVSEQTSLSTGIPESAPTPEATLADADLALAFGDYREAYKLYSGTLPEDTDEFKATALFGQGLTYFKQEDYYQANRILEDLVNKYPTTLPAARAHFILGEAALAEDRKDDALIEFQAYSAARPGVIDHYVYEKIGDLLSDDGQAEAAFEAYKTAYLAAPTKDNLSIAQKVATGYANMGENQAAIDIYKEIYIQTDSDYTKAQMDLLIGRILMDDGQEEEAYAYYQDAVNNFPYAYDSYSALLALLDAGQEVNELQRGLINYYIGQYPLAIEAFDRYLANNNVDLDKALYYKGLATRAQGLVLAGFTSDERLQANFAGGTAEDKAAIQLWSELIATYPASPYRMDAIQAIIETQNSYLGQIQLAIDTALSLAAELHSEAEAPDLLDTAASYLLFDNQKQAAADSWTRIALEFPASEKAFNGLFFGGSVYFELGQFDKAADNFNRIIPMSAEPFELSAAYFWLGKINEAQGKDEEARLNWQAAINQAPYGYYGIRAAELLEGRTPFQEPAQLKLDVDLADLRIPAGEWLKTAFNLPMGTNLDYSSELFDQPTFIRAMEFDRLGMYGNASSELSTLLNENQDDPLDIFRLIKVFLERGYYNSAIEASKLIAKLSGYADTPFSAAYPPYFTYIEYGAYYPPWIKAAAEKYDLSELLLLSVIYQESHFGAQASSGSGARGIMQLMPSTAQQIATETGFLTDFTADDLDIPYYNLELGSNYLSRMLYVFEGDHYQALAAYNAGPGNVINWANVSGEDPDVFLNAIRYLETRVYIRNIVEIFHRYSLIYGQ
ncbi:MAG TPA: transglycosylase SLT domain-containing protein [Anaerolineaceae bacterium]|nr:transglycosylase SLT domain-containing protein [Anaerolineaceae bacterium]